jgi:hypothetical protein
MGFARWLTLALCGLAVPAVLMARPPEPDYRWLSGPAARPLGQTIEPPPGFRRADAPAGSFAAWLRGLPLRAGRPPVLLFDGRLKSNQDAHYAVVDIDVGNKDLQQCADAVMRLRAEYLFARGRGDSIRFHFTSGDLATWNTWAAGQRPIVRGNRVSWRQSSPADASYANFRQYLDAVFMYAGSASLEKELQAVGDASTIEIGDVFIRGGSPGHAVMAVDVASNAAGERMFLIVQSYMPAQDIHVLRNPASASSPWYRAERTGALITPEWTFQAGSLRRFGS